MEGYNGPVLMIISACENNSTNRWVIGALTHQGFENKDSYYGTSGSLYALHPVFNAIPSSGELETYSFIFCKFFEFGTCHDDTKRVLLFCRKGEKFCL